MSKKGSSLGKSIVRDHKKKRKFVNKEGFRHTSDLQDGHDWTCLNLNSVTARSSVDDFLDKVKLADDEFSKEFSNVQILNKDSANGFPTDEQRDEIVKSQLEHRNLLSIPRRPYWDVTTSKEKLDSKERQEFLDWRRNLSLKSQESNLNLTPYEMNLEVWRQLWRVTEKSDVVVQIIDARNPLLFRSEDLEIYVRELDERKRNILLLNKGDLLSEQQRQMWAKYFEDIDVKVVFFSALQSLNSENNEMDGGIQSKTDEDMDDTKNPEPTMAPEDDHHLNDSGEDIKNSSRLLAPNELVEFLRRHGKAANHHGGATTIGLVGYPNVGKSSTINSVLMNKKVQVSSTPGKTKHFQTLKIDEDLCFCDCPGLVFPNFVTTKSDMVVNGILPIDQLTDHMAPMTMIAKLIPRRILESTYSLLLPTTGEQSPDSPATAEEFLNAYGYMRGFMTQRGLPDTARASRYVLKDFVNGKILYCHPPPDTEESDFKKFSLQAVPEKPKKAFCLPEKVQIRNKSDDLDKKFFAKQNSRAHVKGITGYNMIRSSNSAAENETGKPWKKHHNRNKKEKLRRIYSDLDQ